jgi:hypothetical protein
MSPRVAPGQKGLAQARWRAETERHGGVRRGRSRRVRWGTPVSGIALTERRIMGGLSSRQWYERQSHDKRQIEPRIARGRRLRVSGLSEGP